MFKKSLFATLLVVATLSSNVSYGQAWEKSSKVLGLGLGASSFWHLYSGSNYYNRISTPITGQLNFQMEFGVHEYVGVGFQTGVGGGGPIGLGGWGRRGYYGGYYYNYGYNGSFNFPIAAYANFHFYQLIADKTGKDIHADKLDIYAGLNVGSGVGILFFDNNTLITPLVMFGPQVGARYYFTDKFGVNLELGYGKSIVNGGIVFKL
jgi:hypothetical protein